MNAAELVAHVQTLRVDPQFNPEFRQILDLTASGQAAVSYRTIRGLAGMVPFAKTARRIAVVRNDVAYGLFRMYELLIDSSQGRLTPVRTLDAAFELLGIPAEDRGPVSARADRIFDGATPD